MSLLYVELDMQLITHMGIIIFDETHTHTAFDENQSLCRNYKLKIKHVIELKKQF